MSTQNVSDFVHPIRFVERRKLLQTAAAVAAAGVLPVAAAPAPKKITVVTGNPHRRGASFLLTDEFIRGAKEVGAEIYRFDAAFRRVTACSGCDHCGLGSSPCVYRDDMFELNPHLIDCDLVVLSTPLYYFGFSAQLKLVIDRFYAINSQLHSPRQTVGLEQQRLDVYRSGVPLRNLSSIHGLDRCRASRCYGQRHPRHV